MPLLVAVLASLLCSAAAAQGTYKCKDAAGNITYSDKDCELLGLSSAGEVTGRVSVTPALKPRPSGPAAPVKGTPGPSAAPAKPPATAPASQSAATTPEALGKRCFTVKTATGTLTRCNDTPDTPDTPNTPNTPDTRDTSAARATPDSRDTPNAPKTPDSRDTPVEPAETK